MAKIFIVAEHRQGEIGDATFECISLARELASKSDLEPVAVLLAGEAKSLVSELSARVAETIVVEHRALEPFRYESYCHVLKYLIQTLDPFLVIAPHSSFGMELLPRLSAELDRPCVTDCIGFSLNDEAPIALRSIYSGKIEEKVTLSQGRGYFITLRSGCYPAAEKAESAGMVSEHPCPPMPAEAKTEHKGYRETAPGAIDISQAQFILAVGRGVKDAENIPRLQKLADKLGAVLACSRPVVDKKWLGKERQVGTSGKTVKPRAYLALGISGAFQHLAGIKGAGVFIAVNRDPRAPIFRVADYGAAEDLFKIAEALEEKLGIG